MKINRNIALVIFAGVFLILYSRTNSDHDRIKSNHFVLCGTILSMVSARGGLHFEYKYSYEGKMYYSGDAFCRHQTGELYRQGLKYILVVIEKHNPTNKDILEERQDFEKYGITADDTAGITCY